jgi:hypothetical protein
MSGFLRPFEIAEDDLAKLDATQFVQLLKRLIQADLLAHNIPLTAIEGTLRINVADGGEDIRVAWQGGPASTAYIPKRSCIFQCKAENLTDAKLKAEPILADKSALKVAVADVIAAEGAYVLATSKTNTVTPRRAANKSKSASKKSRPSKKLSKSAVKKVKKTTAPLPRLKEMVETIRRALSKYDRRADDTEIRVYGPPKLTDWVNAHPMVAIWVKQVLGYASADFAFQTIDNWSEYRGLSNQLVAWDTLTHHIRTIRDTLGKPGQVVRLLGHSGLGKSRLAFEALASTSNDDAADLSAIVAYARRYTPQVVEQVRDFIHHKRRVVVVVDDCPPDGHRALSEEVHRENSLLSLITLDLEFERPPSEDLEIIIDAVPSEIIRGILTSLGFAGGPEDLERVTQFCSGYPRIAILVSEALKQGTQHFADFKDSDHFVNMLVWGRGQPDPALMRNLRCLALFDAVGIDAPKHEEFSWVAQHLLNLQRANLEASLEHFYNRQIIQRRGYSISVLPRPLAAQLSAIYWKKASDAQKKIMLSGEMPDGLLTALCNRLTDLEYVEHARDIAKQLCGSSGPFGSAKALNTEIGARCLRSLAEVAPREVVDTLVTQFGSWELSKLREQVGPGRRYLVWTLDALSWEAAVFNDAMRILLRFAAAENESWSNNATGEFVQRFRVQLPGTSTSLTQRLDCLSDLAEYSEPEEISVVISAINNAIDARGHSRTVGSERQGTRKVYSDYRPKIWKEIFDYVKGCLLILSRLSETNPDLTPQIRRAIDSIDMGYVIAESVFPDYASLVRKLRPSGESWSSLLDQLSWTLRNRLNGDDVKQIRTSVLGLFNELLPKTLKERILFFVKSVPWHFDENASEQRVDLNRNQQRASELGHECADNLVVFNEVARLLSSGESRQGFAFGQAIYEKTNAKQQVMETAIGALIAAADDNPNPSLLGGMLFVSGREDMSKFESLLEEISSQGPLKQHMVYLAALHLTPRTLKLVVDGLNNGDLTPQSTYILGSGRVMDPLSPESISTLISALRARGSDGFAAAVDLLGMYTHESAEKFRAMRAEIDATLRSEFFYKEHSNRTMMDFHYETLASNLLNDEKYGEPLSEFIAKSLIQLAESKELGNTNLAHRLSSLIFRKFPRQSLELFASYVEQSDRLARWNLGYVIGSPMSFGEKDEGPLFKIDHRTLIDACQKHPKRFAVLVAEIAPIFRFDGVRSWSAVGQALLDTFGRRKEILDALTSNMHTGGWTGPMSDHLKSFIPPLRHASEHKLNQVRVWAKQQLASLNRQIDAAIKDEEEETLRGR